MLHLFIYLQPPINVVKPMYIWLEGKKESASFSDLVFYVPLLTEKEIIWDTAQS